jgi:chromosomal replication initiation ATPase DnaA
MRLHTEHKARLGQVRSCGEPAQYDSVFRSAGARTNRNVYTAAADASNNRRADQEAHLVFEQHWMNKVEIIQRAVLAKFPDVTMADIKSQSRNAKCVLPRHIGMYLCKELTNKSLPDIGRRFGGRDHTTVLNAVNKITSRLIDDEEFRQLVNRIRELI